MPGQHSLCFLRNTPSSSRRRVPVSGSQRVRSRMREQGHNSFLEPSTNGVGNRVAAGDFTFGVADPDDYSVVFFVRVPQRMGLQTEMTSYIARADRPASSMLRSRLENGPDPERQTDECDERTAHYFTIPFERAKSHTLQPRGRVHAQKHVGRDRADGEHDGHHHD